MSVLLTASQIRAAEKYTMKSMDSLCLMERAGDACAAAITSIITTRKTSEVFIFCGSGNNGGDGLVIARKLIESPPQTLCSVYLIPCHRENAVPTPAYAVNFDRWLAAENAQIKKHTITLDALQPEDLSSDCIVVDALFGTGLNKPVEGVQADAIRTMNGSDAFTIAIDIPSGLFSDKHTPSTHDIVMADVTLTIQFLKQVFLFAEAYPFYGEVFVMDIEMLPDPNEKCTRKLLTASWLKEMLATSNPYAHKGTYGHGLLIAGSDKMPGAALISAKSAMRGGIGKLTVHSTQRVLQALPIVLPEAMLDPDDNAECVSDIQWHTLASSINAIAMGPGLGCQKQTCNAMKRVLDAITSPIILDADALNMLSENKTWLSYLPEYSILTPHILEFERLVGPVENDFDRVEKARCFAQKYNVILILKGHHTVISLPDGTQYFNTTGNEGMATAGSGDALTGLLLALLAQGYSPAVVALLGVYIHGLAGDLCAHENGPQGLIASDLPLYYGKAIQSILDNSVVS